MILPDLPAEYDVCMVPHRATPGGGCASWPFPRAGTAVCAGTIRWLTVLRLSVGFERDSSAVVLGAIGFTIEYFIVVQLISAYSSRRPLPGSQLDYFQGILLRPLSYD